MGDLRLIEVPNSRVLNFQGGRLREAYIVRGMDLNEVAERLGKPKGQVVRWQDGRLMPRRIEVIEMSRLFDLDFRFFQRPVMDIDISPIFVCSSSIIHECWCSQDSDGDRNG